MPETPPSQEARRRGPLAYIEHDGRVFTVDQGGRTGLPAAADVPFAYDELARVHVDGAEVIVGAARLDAHPTDWVAKDAVPLLDSAEPVLRGAVNLSLYRPVVGVIAIRDDAMLLVRPNRGVATDRWTLPGGFIEAFEDPADGARREMREEVGLDPGELTLLGVWVHQVPAFQFPVLGIAYGTRQVDGDPVPNPDEIAEAAWVPIDKARTLASGMAADAVARWEELTRVLA